LKKHIAWLDVLEIMKLPFFGHVTYILTLNPPNTKGCGYRGNRSVFFERHVFLAELS